MVFYRFIKAKKLFPLGKLLFFLADFLVCLCVLFCAYRHSMIVVHESVFDVNETSFVLTEKFLILH